MAQAARTAVILLVDDDGPGRHAHARILRGAGYEVREAATGTQALELLAQDLPDLAILDIRLPGASGSEVLRQIRANPATAALPAMYLSAAYADEASIAQGLEEGADAYLTKPVAPAVLLGQVTALLRVGRVNRALRQTEMELREAQRVARVGSWYWNAETDAVTVSEQIYRMLGLDPALPISTLREWEWRLYTPESQERVRDAVQTALQTGAGYTLEVEAQRVDGTPLWIAARAEVVRGAGGRIVGLRGTNQDITDYKQAEQSAIAAERARAEIAEHMGDEIDHRVKNNLAMVSGLLQMQLLREQDPHIAGALRDAIGRIRTFVTLHEQMYAARTEEADLLVAVQRIAATMGELFAARDDVAINVRGDPFRCSARVATNLSVATSELVTNALKHGGPGADGRRTVAISLHPAEETVTLSVWNSGNPIPNSIDPARSQTLGLRLVHDVVVGRYGGGFRLYPSDGGTLAEVVVPGEAMRADSAPR